MELAFLRQERLPIPRQCIDCRHNERIAQRAKMFLYHRQCACNPLSGATAQYQNQTKHFHGDNPCPTEFETAYPPEDPRLVYCLKCFYDEIA